MCNLMYIFFFRIIKTPVLVCSVFFLMHVMAADDFTPVTDINAGLLSIDSKRKTIATVQGSFIQKKVSAVFNKEIIQNGVYYSGSGSRLRWELRDPQQYVVFILGERIYYSENNRTRELPKGQSRMFQMIGENMLGTIGGTQSGFKTELFENDVLYKVCMTPAGRRAARGMKGVELILSKETGATREVRILDSDTEYTLIQFITAEINKDIDESLFIPGKIPASAEKK